MIFGCKYDIPQKQINTSIAVDSERLRSNEPVQINGAEIEVVESCNYLGSTLLIDGGAKLDITN